MAEHLHEHGHEHHAHDHHGHEHAHEKTVQAGCATLELSSHMHEQAATVSATVHVAEGHTMPFTRVVEAMGAIAERAEGAGGIVGHIKGYAETASGFAHASCTDASLGANVEGDPGLLLDSAAKAQLVAIVMLIDVPDLERIVVEALAQ